MGAVEELSAELRKWLEPLFQKLEREYREGKKEPILHAIAFSLVCDAEIPAWAKYAFIDACLRTTASKGEEGCKRS